MAANYWDSTQKNFWLFDKRTLADIRQTLEKEEAALVQQYPLPDRRHLSIFFNQQLNKLGRRMNVRQQAIATAQVYIRRFYIKVEIRRTNPYLVLATALYLACKMEECPQHIRAIVSEGRNMWPEFIVTDVSKLGECEFFLISELNCQLIVHHPYRTLNHLQSKLDMGADEVTLTWSIINDHYLTDLPLLYPLHVIAVAAIFLALTLKPNGGLQAGNAAAASIMNAVLSKNEPQSKPTDKGPNQTMKLRNLISWVAESDIDIKAMIECTQEIISLYEIFESYNDKTCKEQIARYVKARNLDR